MAKPFTLQEVQQWFLERNSQYLNPSYEGCFSSVTFICSSCNKEETSSSFSNLKHKNPKCLCKQCIRKEISKQQSIPLEKIQQFFLDKNSKLLNPEEYKNSESPIKFSCSQCYKEASYNSFYHLQKNNPNCICKQCRLKEHTTSISKIQQWFLIRQSKLLNPEDYKNTKSPITFLCSQCHQPDTRTSFRSLKTTNPKCLCIKCQFTSKHIKTFSSIKQTSLKA